ncbi:MAG: trigger factor [Anaerolineae bacterium]|nr:trigger factor [Caldilineales bacterium]MCX7852660.1 trigger factor [Caldilineales bacterium]MDW8269622.1 trigger factor [Anaerolineae bacterium]
MTDLILTQQALENRRVLLSIEFPKERLDELMRATARRLSREYRFPGFRPGKVPYHVVVQRIGRENLLREVALSVGEEVIAEALKAADIKPHGPIDVDITLDPFAFRVEVPLAPTIELMDYRSLRLEPPTLEETAVEEHVRQDLDAILQERKTWVVVERPAQYGDRLVVDFRVEVDGEVVLSHEDWDFVPDATDYTLTPAFDAAFVGMRAGEQKTFSAVFPEDSEWPGKEGHFTITLKAVKTQQAPELTDELAQQLGYENAAKMLDELRKHAEATVRSEQEATYADQVFQTVVDRSQIEFAPSTLESMLEAMLEEEARQFRAYGIESPEDYLRLIRKTKEAYYEERRAEAEASLRRQLVFEAIAEREQLTVGEQELHQALVERYGHDPTLLAKAEELLTQDDGFRNRVVASILIGKVLDLLKRIARGESVPAPGQHAVATASPAAEAAPVGEVEAESAETAEALPTAATEIGAEDKTTSVAIAAEA